MIVQGWDLELPFFYRLKRLPSEDAFRQCIHLGQKSDARDAPIQLNLVLLDKCRDVAHATYRPQDIIEGVEAHQARTLD